MKTVFVFNDSRIIGGGEISFLDLVSEIRGHGVEPIAFVPGPGEVKHRLDELGSKTVISPFPKIAPHKLSEVFRAYKRISGLLAYLKPDIVHVNGARSMLYAGMAARANRVPCVWHVRVIERDRILDRIRARLASGIIANSSAVLESLKPFLPPGKRVDVIYNGFDIDAIRAVPVVDVQKEFGLPDVPVIFAAGRMTRWKGFEDLIRACAILETRKIPHACLIVGDALPDEKEYEYELKKTAHDCGLKNIRFLGWREDVVAIMKSADLFVLPSHGEPFGRVIIEAWVCGLAVVATSQGGPKELIEHGVTGMLTPVGDVERMADTIAGVVADDKLRAGLAGNAAERVGSFSLKTHAEKIVELYKSELNGHK